MPIPAGASLIAAIIHFTPVPLAMRKVQIDFAGFTFDSTLFSVLLMMLTAILALLMVSTIPYNNFKNTSGKPGMSRNQTVILIAVMILAIYQWSQVVLLVMATCYASLGPVAKIVGIFKPKNNSEEPTDSISPTNISPEIELKQQS
jgi:CDP-diacylglycerol--serine O-phosphatidyltransferase